MSDSISKFFENNAHWTDYINTNNMKERKYENALHFIMGVLSNGEGLSSDKVRELQDYITLILHEEQEKPQQVIRG